MLQLQRAEAEQLAEALAIRRVKWEKAEEMLHARAKELAARV